MKTVKMSLISLQGKIVNQWSVPFARHTDALGHAMDRAQQEGHAGVMWSVINNGKAQSIAFDSHDPKGTLEFALAVQPYQTTRGLDVERMLREGQPGQFDQPIVPVDENYRNERRSDAAYVRQNELTRSRGRKPIA